MNISTGLFPQQALLERRNLAAKKRIAQSLDDDDARPLRLGVAQIRNHCGGQTGKEGNLERMVDCVKMASEHGVQALVLPEMCLPGYFTKAHGAVEEGVAAAHGLADVVGTSPFLNRIAETAKAAAMLVAFGFSERDGECFYNSVGVVDTDGRWLGVRRKNPLSPHAYELTPFTEPPPSERGTVFPASHGVIGVCNCFDGEFPESVRRMRLAGAELLLWSNAGSGNAQTGSSSRFNQCGSYAQTNRMWVASCNAVGTPFYGNSCIYAPWGEPLVQLPTTEEALGVAQINLALAKDWPMYRDRLDPDIV
ncbi:MAG: carbon-nitrogen hydrolase family protein [Lentisphaerae bacterium]|jgi:N-carbamoylputrescine amidase|nr:carbon-nitrogen hydrolase family protein [Lentisphaerota bacterium]MBT4819693.1 carbon-nitrogen hydrolase family protein [Lentisphaerota bacterium]MBT5606346.1 carbon-nitrogen hydrolase family protein [Lentisphaerota bacterium]MBT7056799.1 carbon-nitrogen hydrolase family protein [Lentisphaerota bacterium]MBT7840404.1 carbon-nitrogen hydrolase family protein [Lentisphaerota bacterium]